MCNLRNEKTFFHKGDTTIIENKHFSIMILGNKDVQYCDRSVVFSRSHATEVGGMAPRELNNSLIFLIVFPVASNISGSFEKSFPSISIAITFVMFDAANFSFKFL